MESSNRYRFPYQAHNLYSLLINEWSARCLLCVVILLGFTMRLYAGWLYNADLPDSPARLVGDAPGYDKMAHGLLQGLGFTTPSRVPLYPLWLMGVHWLTGGSYNAVPYIQAVLGAMAILLTYVLGSKLFGYSVGLVAAFLAATSFVLIRQSALLLSEVLYTPIILLVAITLWDAINTPSSRRFVWAGFWAGISMLVRPMLLLFPVVLIWVLGLTLNRKQVFRYFVAYVLTIMLVITPWILYNYIRYDALFALQTSSAILWQGSPEFYHLVHDQGYTYAQIWTEVFNGPGREAYDPGTVKGDRYWTERAIKSIRSEPLIYLLFTVEKLATYWVGDPHQDWNNSYVFNYRALEQVSFSRLAAMLTMISRSMPVLALLAVIYLRHKWRVLMPIYSILLYSTLLHAMTHAEARLSEPLQPYLFVLIGGALVQLVAPYLARYQVSKSS